MAKGQGQVEQCQVHNINPVKMHAQVDTLFVKIASHWAITFAFLLWKIHTKTLCKLMIIIHRLQAYADTSKIIKRKKS